MGATGEGSKGILIIGEAPGVTEDEMGKQFVGESGQLLERYLKDYGIDLHKDCRLINAINCRPPANRTPTPREIVPVRGLFLCIILVLLYGLRRISTKYQCLNEG